MRASVWTGTALAVFLAGCSARPLPLGATEQSKSLHDQWVVFFWVGTGVAVVIYALIAWCVVRYRRRSSDIGYPDQFRDNKRWEIVYTGIPILMVIVLFLITYASERHVEAIAQTQAVVVNVTGFRWSWRFDYPQLDITVAGTPQVPPELVLPLGETTRFNVASVDVDHSFWVPAFLFKRDAIPGLENVFDWTPSKLGTFRGECGEFCGLDHALMTFAVRVVSPHEFSTWVRTHRGIALSSPATAAP